MEENLTNYLRKQRQIVIDKGGFDDSDMNPLTASQLAMNRIKTCKTNRNCVEYVIDLMSLTWPIFGEAFLVNYCCESCNFYKSEQQDS